MARNLDNVIIDLLESTARNIKAHPVNLGGVSGAGGGVGGPPGGFIGQLPQKRVTYDTDEFAYSGIESVPSGSLVDNLAHIRFRLDELESGSGITGSGVIVVDDNEIITYDPTTTIHFSGAGVTVVDLGDGEVQVNITATGSGGSGTPLTVEEYDGSPSVTNVDKIVFSGATVTDLGAGDVLVTFSGGGGFGTTEHIVNEVPSGVLDSVNDTYYTEYEYSPTTLAVYLNGQRLKELGEDYTEISQGFIMVIPPESTDILLVDYLRTITEAGNADTLDGYHASSFSQSDHNHDDRYIRISGDSLIPERSDPTSLLVAGFWQMYIKGDGLYLRNDVGLIIGPMLSVSGWHNIKTNWTRTGNHTFTVSGDETAVYRKGTKVRYQDGGSDEYGVVGSSSHAAGTTTVTLITNNDYAMAAATITDTYISYIENPAGWPDWFDYSPTFSGLAPMTYTATASISKWRSVGVKTIMVKVRGSGTTGGTASNTIRASLPIDCADAASFPTAFGQVNDGGPIAARCAITGGTPDTIDAVRYDNANYGLGAGRVMNVGVIYEF